MIRVNNLHKYYNKGKKNEQHVLNDVSVELGATGLVCILGESGSGKTTLLNTIGGLDTFSGGTIEIDGTTIKKYNPRVMEPIRNEHFDYVFQNYYLLQDYSVAYNIKLALNRYQMTEEEKDERVDYVLETLGLSKYKKKIVSKLSGGQKQRVSIARALVKSPDVILADEPTGNLDEENTIRTMSILKNISKECLVILVSHEKRIARFFADRIIEIRDGKIYKDEENQVSGTYQRSDDANIYLKEMEQSRLESEQALIRIYQDKAGTQEHINLTLAWKEDKLYIQNNMDCDIIIEGVDSGVQILDEERPSMDLTEVENLEYSLPKLKSKGKAKLSPREIWRMTLENIHLMGKKQAFVIGIMLVTAVLLSITMVEFINTVAVDEAAVIGTDTHYVSMRVEKNVQSRFGSNMWRAKEFIDKSLSDNSHGTPFFIPELKVYMTGSGYAQLGNLTQMLQNYSYTSSEYLKQEDLIYGQLPKKRDEVVIDKQLIERTEAQNGPVTSLQDGLESYVGMVLKVGGVDVKLHVVGISDTKQSVLYSGQNILLGMNANGYKIASVPELQLEDTENFKDLTLKDDEILVRRGMYESMYRYNESSDIPEEEVAGKGETISFGDDEKVYKIVGTFSNDIPADYVMSDAGCLNIRNLMIYENYSCMIYTNDKAAALDYFGKAAKEYEEAFDVTLSDLSQEQIKEYKENHSENMGATNLITFVIVLISLVMVYFTIKSNASSRSEELTVYRLLGISRGSILKAYMLEMVLMTCYTSLPAVLVTGGVIRFISSVPSLEMNLIFPWWSLLLLLAAIYAVHMLISILPVYGILSKPPATLAVKE